MSVISALVDKIQHAKTILIVPHTNPDGDSLGSQLALAIALKKLGKEVVSASADFVPEIYRFLPNSDLINTNVISNREFDIAITVECPSVERAGSLTPAIKKSKIIINIDHHPSNTNFGHYNYINVEAAAVGEQVYEILKRLAKVNGLKTLMDKDIATCLYVSIVTDTGGFAYANTSYKTHKLTAHLLEYGVKPYNIYQLVYENNSIGKFQLLSCVLKTLETAKNGKVAWLSMTREMLKRTNTKVEDTEGFINYPRAIKGVEVAVFFKEGDDGKIRISFRSRGNIDVNNIALFFKGGGHIRAAGCTVEGTLDEVKERVLSYINSRIELPVA